MGSAKRSSTDNVLKVDPQRKRPPNAGESVPETLVPEVVHTNLHRSDADGAAEVQAAPDRWQRIQHRAYEIAQERGFTPGAELNDWLQAEREIDAEMSGGARQAAPQDRPQDQLTG
jgi:hypothetical protein